MRIVSEFQLPTVCPKKEQRLRSGEVTGAARGIQLRGYGLDELGRLGSRSAEAGVYWLGAAQDVLVNVVVAPVALSVASGVIVVDGNHGGAKLPCANLRSNHTF